MVTCDTNNTYHNRGGDPIHERDYAQQIFYDSDCVHALDDIIKSTIIFQKQKSGAWRISSLVHLVGIEPTTFPM